METIIKMILSNPEVIVDIVKENSDKYRPILLSVCDEIITIMKDFADKKEFAEIDATKKINLLNSYMGVGFSREEAMQLIIHETRNNAALKADVQKQLSTSLGGLI